MSKGKCEKCNGRGFTNKRVARGDGINIKFVPPEMQICECSAEPAHR